MSNKQIRICVDLRIVYKRIVVLSCQFIRTIYILPLFHSFIYILSFSSLKYWPFLWYNDMTAMSMQHTSMLSRMEFLLNLYKAKRRRWGKKFLSKSCTKLSYYQHYLNTHFHMFNTSLYIEANNFLKSTSHALGSLIFLQQRGLPLKQSHHTQS